MIRIDGSFGEGGGQILRSALTLSLLTGTAIEIHNIRARRPKPGLMTQHLFAVQAAAAVGDARVEGVHLGSTQLSFEPRTIRSGDFRFDLHTAGSTSLILQTIGLPLSYTSRNIFGCADWRHTCSLEPVYPLSRIALASLSQGNGFQHGTRA